MTTQLPTQQGGEVDVLAVLALHGRCQMNPRHEYPRLSANDELQQVHDAVADLIGAAKEYLSGTYAHVYNCEHCKPRIDRLSIALSRVGATS